jgi:uncharacterized membrane protein YhaH (DUF805 family)
MDFKQAIQHVLQNYANFEGRACRSEYWYWVLAIFIVHVVLQGIGLHFIDWIFALATLVPSFAVGVRRLHDIDKTGWLVLIVFIPFVGWIIMIVWAATKGTDGPNQYGADPLAGLSAA